MKRLIILTLVLLLCGAVPVYSVKKDTQMILDEIQKTGILLRDIQEKVHVMATETAQMAQKIKLIEDKVKAITISQADNNQDRENLQLSLQFIKEELNDLKNSVSKINEKLISMPAGSAPAGEENQGTPSQDTTAQPPESIYYTAYSDYLKENYDLAVEGFRQFINQYPNNGLADNSLYWIGECFYSQKKYQDAVNTFKEVRTNYKDGDKVPDAMLKEGFALIEMGQQNLGIETLKLLVSEFPLSEEASLAQQKIKEVSE